MRALVCLALISTCAAFGQNISTKNAYLPSALAAQLRADLIAEDLRALDGIDRDSVVEAQ